VLYGAHFEVMIVIGRGMLALSLALVVWNPSAACLAQQTATPSNTLAESLSEEVNDPTATLTQAQIQ